MDFNTYLQQYEQRKRLQGGLDVSAKEAGQIFTPYFNGLNNRQLAGERVDLQARAEADQNRNAINNLALERYKNDLQVSAAATGDTNQLIGNAASAAASLGGVYLLKQGGYFNPYRRY